MTDKQIISNTKLEIIKASDIKPKEVRWLWYPYAKKYIYSFSTRRRVYKWVDLNVSVWI